MLNAPALLLPVDSHPAEVRWKADYRMRNAPLSAVCYAYPVLEHNEGKLDSSRYVSCEDISCSDTLLMQFIYLFP